MRKHSLSNILRAVFLGLSISNMPFALAGSLEHIKNVWVDKKHNLVIDLEMPKNQFPDMPSMLVVPEPKKRIVIDFNKARFDEATMPTKVQLLDYFTKIFNGVEKIDFLTIDDNDTSMARLIIYFDKYTDVKPQVEGIDLSHVVVNLHASLTDPDLATYKSVYKEPLVKYGYYPYHKYDAENSEKVASSENMFLNDNNSDKLIALAPRTNENSTESLDPSYSKKYEEDLDKLNQLAIDSDTAAGDISQKQAVNRFGNRFGRRPDSKTANLASNNVVNKQAAQNLFNSDETPTQGGSYTTESINGDNLNAKTADNSLTSQSAKKVDTHLSDKRTSRSLFTDLSTQAKSTSNISQNTADKDDFDFGVRPSNPSIPLDLKPPIATESDNESATDNVNHKQSMFLTDNLNAPSTGTFAKPVQKTQARKEFSNQSKSTVNSDTVSSESSKTDKSAKASSQNSYQKSLENSKTLTARKDKALKDYNEAVKYHMAGKLDLAQKYYLLSIKAYPDLAESHSNLGLIYNQKHDYVDAMVEFNRAIAINPNDAITYNGIGATLRAKQDVDGAIKNWLKALKLDPNLVIAYFNLASAYEVEKDYNKAIGCYRNVIEKDPKMGEAYYRLAMLLERKGKYAEAMRYFKESLKVTNNGDYIEDAKQRLAYLESKKL